ncbi:hypothetical protein PYW08_011427 [Mythimna loreyi]|uniref:Uncharacterized protein n=1 Tax=Mythimna loreyi TaxID=667449 RepID=A0ACC2Q8F0_9NEOP|nr:hypothetical protein PYW08_011427 [Mythimna loreyi]
MNNTIDLYCRMCAELKPHNTLENLQNDEELCQQVVNKLSKFNIVIDFESNILPKTVCLPCVNRLNEAFAFVTAVEEAQAFLNDFILVRVKSTDSDSSDENILYEPPDDLKIEEAQESIEIYNESILQSSSHEDVTCLDNTVKLEPEDVNNKKASLDIVEENSDTNNECDKPHSPEIFSDLPHIECNKNPDTNSECDKPHSPELFSDLPHIEGNKNPDTNGECDKPHSPELFSDLPHIEGNKNSDTNNECDKSHSPEIFSDLPNTEGNRNSVEEEQKVESMEISDDDSSDSYFITDAFLDDYVSHTSKSDIDTKDSISSYDDDDDFDNTEEWETENTNAIKPLENIVTNDKCTNRGKKQQLTTSVFTETRLNKTQSTSKEYKDYSNIVTKYTDTDVNQIKETWRDYKCTCSNCGTIFSNIKKLRSHSLQYHNACNLYQCLDCPLKRSKFKAFMDHVKSHRMHLAQSCYKCFKIFPTREQATSHRRKVHDNFDYFCPGCDAAFDSNEELKAHMNKYYNKLVTRVPPHLTCGICNKISESDNEFKKHLQTHRGIKSWFCDTCGKKLSTKGNLKEHIQGMHTSEKSFQCDVCGASFTTKMRLRNHKVIHVVTEPLICDHCGKIFRNKFKIVIHMKLHHGARKRFPCTVCKKKFKFHKNLKQHMLQHTGEKPYSCHICLREFTNLPNRNKHIRRIHGIEMAKKKKPTVKQEIATDLTSRVKKSSLQAREPHGATRAVQRRADKTKKNTPK